MFEWRTIKKNIELPLEIMGYSKKDRSDRADEMLEMVGLTKFAIHYPQQLSGGMAAESRHCQGVWYKTGDFVDG